MASKKKPMTALIRKDFFGASLDIPRITEIRLENIQPNPDQPRKYFDENALSELASSIAEKGLLQPIVVRRVADNNYMVVAGERRFRAYTMLGKETIPAIVSEGNVDELALIENMQREDLKPMELAEALARLIETYGYTHEVAAKMLGKARNTITELLSLNRIPKPIRDECRAPDIANRVSRSVLVELARMDGVEQEDAWERIKQGGETLKSARVIKTKGVDAERESAPSGKKPKMVYNTGHSASVIIQAETDQALTPEQVVGALEDALQAARKLVPAT